VDARLYIWPGRDLNELGASSSGPSHLISERGAELFRVDTYSSDRDWVWVWGSGIWGSEQHRVSTNSICLGFYEQMAAPSHPTDLF